MQLGRYPAAHTTIAHLSDTHLLAGGAPLGGAADTVTALDQAVAQLTRLGTTLDAIVVTGDIADLGEPDAYRLAHAALAPLAEAAGAELVWVMGNHDERGPFRAGLLGEADVDPGVDPADEAPVNRVVEVGGVRFIAFDSSVPGWHHGAIDAAGVRWLEQVLAEPAPRGSVLCLHHAPIATSLQLMDVLELQGQFELEAVLRGSDVRLILGGHLHYPTTGAFAGIPVSVAGATAYTMDVSAPPRELVGVDGGRSVSIVQLFDDGFTSSVVPLGPFSTVSHFGAEYLDALEALPAAERLARFSRKPEA